MTNEQIEEILEREAWRVSLAEYAERASGGKWKAWRWLQTVADAVTEAVLAGDGRIIVNAPPQHGKSELLSHWLPTWFLDLFADKRVILTSYADSLATDFGRKVRNELATNKLCLSRLAGDATKASDWRTSAGGGMLTRGVGGGITGKGGDLIIVDDPFKGWKEAQSRLQRQTVIDWFKATLYTRRQPGTTIIVVQTRWHERDLAGYLISEHDDDWQHLRLPALAEAGDILERQIGEALCEERFTRAALEATAVSMGSQMFAGLYQQRPAPAEGAIIQRDWIQRYASLPSEIEEWWQSWDLTFDETERGSYVVGQVWARKGANCYLVQQFRKRVDFVASLAAVKTMTERYPQALKKKVEKKANGAALLSVLRASVPGLVAVEPRGDKETRLRAVSPLFEAGNVLVPERAEWVDDWIEELVTFPSSEQDDQVDATSQALSDIQARRIGEIKLNLDFSTQPSYWSTGVEPALGKYREPPY